MARMADRIKNYPEIPISTDDHSHSVSNVRGTVDSGYNGETADVKGVTATKEQAAPKNPSTTWSAGS